MGVLIDFNSYRNCMKNCTTCENTTQDEFIGLPVCCAVFSDFRGQIVNEEIVCPYYIRRNNAIQT